MGQRQEVAAHTVAVQARGSGLMPIVVDLFCGVGGFSLGAFRAGFEVVAAVDNDPRVAAAFRRNFPTCPMVTEDISKLDGKRIVDQAGPRGGRLDGIIGGPPCQGFSYIGRRRVDDKRNHLFESFFRIVSELKPTFFVAENVTGILSDKYAHYREDAVARVPGYTVLDPVILKSSDFGAPTTRSRVFFVGFLQNSVARLSSEDFQPAERVEHITVGDALRGLPTKIHPGWQSSDSGWRKLDWRGEGWFWERSYEKIPPDVGDAEAIQRLREQGEVSGCQGTRHSEAVAKRFSELQEGEVDRPSRARRLDRKGLCPTIRSGTGPEHGSHQAVRPIHPTQPRVITPREAARLQGFPDWFQFDGTKWHSFRQIGNSVSPILAEAVLTAIAKRLY